MNKNIVLAYILASVRNTWFWLGIWVFYYLNFTNYAGIGVIETVLIISITVMEIPTGAIADLFGKKNTLVASFLLEAICYFMMTITPNYYFLLLAVFVGGVGTALYSGTMEAFVYDTLIEEKKEKLYSKVLGNITTFQYITMAVSGIVGGFIYVINPRLPFLAAALFSFIGFLIALFLKEPAVDSLKFSFTNFLEQNKRGLIQLFNRESIKREVILLLIIGAFVVISDEMLNDILAVEFGFKPHQLGIFVSVVSLIAAGVSQMAPKIIKIFDGVSGVILFGLLLSLTYIVSPWVGIFVGGATLLLRVCFQTVFNNMSSVTINNLTESKDRAVTLSSFNMIKNLPYVLSAYFLGSLMDLFTARKFALAMGVVMAILIIVQSIRIRINLRKQSI